MHNLLMALEPISRQKIGEKSCPT